MDLHFWVKISPNFRLFGTTGIIKLNKTVPVYPGYLNGPSTHCLGRGGRRGSRVCQFLSPRCVRSLWGTFHRDQWPGSVRALLHISTIMGVTWGDSVPSSLNLWPWSCSPMIMCITPCMKGCTKSWLKLWTGWMKGWKA